MTTSQILTKINITVHNGDLIACKKGACAAVNFEERGCLSPCRGDWHLKYSSPCTADTVGNEIS